MAEPGDVPGLHITVAWSPERGQVQECSLVLSAGATLADALAAWRGRGLSAMEPAASGVWGRVVPPETVLRDGDRVELYRPLTVDPKEARRQRFAAQGRRSAGLFTRKR